MSRLTSYCWDCLYLVALTEGYQGSSALPCPHSLNRRWPHCSSPLLLLNSCCAVLNWERGGLCSHVPFSLYLILCEWQKPSCTWKHLFSLYKEFLLPPQKTCFHDVPYLTKGIRTKFPLCGWRFTNIAREIFIPQLFVFSTRTAYYWEHRITSCRVCMFMRCRGWLRPDSDWVYMDVAMWRENNRTGQKSRYF